MKVMSTMIVDTVDLKDHALFSQCPSHHCNTAISRRTCQLKGWIFFDFTRVLQKGVSFSSIFHQLNDKIFIQNHN